RVPAIMRFLQGVEAQFSVKPMIYTAPNFWQQFIAPNCTAQDNQTFATYPLWVVDLRNTGALPAPWRNVGATFVQTHFGETATTNDPFDRSDQDKFPGSAKDLLNKTFAGYTIAKGAPFSFIIMDIQTKLKALGILQDAADGIFGNNTEGAVRSFQQANGLQPSGIVDAATWNKLLT
ncbi:MAG TPA: peptidoglycan-binding protein, partial [Chitinophagaceae bacterium]|nr:peptidoglycan-binding protein [Chitinophagaceae bacterium]